MGYKKLLYVIGRGGFFFEGCVEFKFLNLKATMVQFKKDLVHLQSKFFSRQIFLLYFGKGNFGGKKFTLHKRLFG
jgi:hypothetical protein